MLTHHGLASDLKHVGTLPTLSTNAHAWRAHAWRMAPANERAGRVDTAHIAPHKSINGAWPMADGHTGRPPGLLAAGRMAARLAGRMADGRQPPGSLAAGRVLFADGPRAGPAADGHGSGGATNKIFYCPHCPHDPQIFKFIFGIFGTCLKAYLLHRARSKRLRRA